MTKRILGLLWRISLASQMHAPLDMALCFADVLRDYALTSKSADTRELALDYVSQLVQELNGSDRALPAMRVLTHLIANSGNHAVSLTTYSRQVVPCHAKVLACTSLPLCAAAKDLPGHNNALACKTFVATPLLPLLW